MNIEELRNKHYENVSKADKYSYLLGIEESHFAKEHMNLSVEFAIGMLEESITETSYHEVDSFCKNKIEVLKQYLNGNV